MFAVVTFVAHAQWSSTSTSLPIYRTPYVGIGSSTTPTSMLHITQSSNVDWATTILNTGGSGKGLLIRSAAGDATPVLQVEDNSANLRFRVKSSGETFLGGHFNAGMGNELWSDASLIYFNYRGSAATTHFWNLGGSTGNSILTLMNTGRVGIGNSVPASLLHLQQANSGWADGIRLSYGGKSWDFVSDSNGDRLIIAKNQDIPGNGLVISNGKLGVGVPSPTSKLHVAGDATVDGLAIPSTNGQTFLFIQKPVQAGKPFSITLGGQSITDGIMIGREDWLSKVIIPWNVGIGTSNPREKLEVNGTVYSREVKVDVQAGTGPDYVFEKEYDLPSLESIKTYIDENKHLPEVPTAKQMEANGMNVGEMNLLLLKKIEELTLYLIDIKKENEVLKNRIDQIENKNR